MIEKELLNCLYELDIERIQLCPLLNLLQGEDLLFQIFTSNMLQRAPGDEAPFFEFIQRVCSEYKCPDGCEVKLKPGCGGFGIRNFLTLFLSIEVSKALNDLQISKLRGDMSNQTYAEKMISLFTDQLDESNPILTEISDCMTSEGRAREEMAFAVKRGNEEEVGLWRKKVDGYTAAKQVGNAKLMECSTKYKMLMKRLREEHVNSNL